MSFDALDASMRVFETAHDHCVLPDIYIVARLDGRGFTRMTKERHAFEAPFDARFHAMMVTTTTHLMDCGFHVVYGYTQSDEISLLFHRDDQGFGRKLRKIESVLAGEASATFSLALGDRACFDCRVSQLPNADRVAQYFGWRADDAARNALSAWCYWTLRGEGQSVAAATAAVSGLGVAAKNELLFTRGINFNTLPVWQRRGVAVYHETYIKHAVDGRTGAPVEATRRRLTVDEAIPHGADYEAFVRRFIAP